MMYVGHFSFARQFDEGGNREPYHCHLSAVAKASSVAAAMRKFKALLKKVSRGRYMRDMFVAVDEIYLDACVEVRSVPVAGFVTLLDMQEGESTGGMRAALPDVSTRNAACYGLGKEPEVGETTTPEPFVILRKGNRVRRSAPKAVTT